MTTNPKPTPSSFYRAAATATTDLLAPVDPVIPPAGPTSLGRDALLPPTDGIIYSPNTQPWSAAVEGWRNQIAAEQLCDVETRFYRTPSTASPVGVTLRKTDGAFMRKPDGDALAITPRAWQQFLTLLLQEVPNKPTAGAAKCYGFLDPATRATVIESLKARSRREEGEGNEIMMRTYFDPRHGMRVLRAVLSGRHSGIHFDDLALSRALDLIVPSDAPAYVYRDVDGTRGYAVLDTSTAEARATVSWSNSETGAASIAFAGGCYITALDSVIVGTFGRVDVDVTIARTSDRTRRAHTLPRKNRSDKEREAIAMKRMSTDLTKATESAKELCAAWGRAVKTFAPGYSMRTTEDRALATEIVLDLIEQHTRGFADTDRAALTKIFNDDSRLKSIPFASAAYIAGAWAVLARTQTSWEEAARMQDEAARWVMRPFGRA